MSAYLRKSVADHGRGFNRLDCWVDGAYEREYDPAAFWDID